ncbi:MAG: ABC transporter ATP-binding protein [Dehalococcoidia bacterium]|nr:ABC transporter ATP-binding protein [Dehalococcoidia bacterium]MDD5493159.1 ABC transporter ATP-binding protein [Dehalococcoidia bacterium]
MIEVKDLQKTYTGKVPVHALKGVSFDIPSGQFVALMGPSGSGKSTLLHQLALLDTPTSGGILLDGVDILSLSQHAATDFRLRHMGYVFQEYALIPELNAIENAFLPLMLLGIHRKEYIRIAGDLMDKVGLSDRLHHLISELSGGEQQRVAIARALVNKSKILFADEPCANLDTENKGIVLRLLRKLCNELGQTILMVTHEPEQREFADRVLWLRDGRLEKEEYISKDTQEEALHNGYRTDISSDPDYLKDD